MSSVNGFVSSKRRLQRPPNSSRDARSSGRSTSRGRCAGSRSARAENGSRSAAEAVAGGVLGDHLADEVPADGAARGGTSGGGAVSVVWSRLKVNDGRERPPSRGPDLCSTVVQQDVTHQPGVQRGVTGAVTPVPGGSVRPRPRGPRGSRLDEGWCARSRAFLNSWPPSLVPARATRGDPAVRRLGYPQPPSEETMLKTAFTALGILAAIAPMREAPTIRGTPAFDAEDALPGPTRPTPRSTPTRTAAQWWTKARAFGASSPSGPSRPASRGTSYSTSAMPGRSTTTVIGSPGGPAPLSGCRPDTCRPGTARPRPTRPTPRTGVARSSPSMARRTPRGVFRCWSPPSSTSRRHGRAWSKQPRRPSLRVPRRWGAQVPQGHGDRGGGGIPAGRSPGCADHALDRCGNVSHPEDYEDCPPRARREAASATGSSRTTRPRTCPSTALASASPCRNRGSCPPDRGVPWQ